MPLWTAAALFSDNLDGEILSTLSKHLSTDERALQLLTQHRVLRRENEHYHMLVPVARFALDQAQRGASGFDWRAVREALNPFFLGIAQSADSIASTDTALKAQHTLIRHFGARHRYALELCRETPPALNLIAQLHEKLHNQYQFQPSLGREMAQAIEAALSGHPQYDRTRAGALQSLGDLERRLDNLEQARAHYRDALELHQKVQNDPGKANTLQSLGDLEQTKKQYGQALQIYAEALALYERVRTSMGMAYTAAEMIRCLHALGMRERMEPLAPFALQQAVASNTPAVMAYVVGVLREVGYGEEGQAQAVSRRLRRFKELVFRAFRGANRR